MIGILTHDLMFFYRFWAQVHCVAFVINLDMLIADQPGISHEDMSEGLVLTAPIWPIYPNAH